MACLAGQLVGHEVRSSPIMQELQSIVKGRGGSGSLLDSLKTGSKGTPDIVQKGIIAPLTGSPQSAAFNKAPALPKAGGRPLIYRISLLEYDTMEGLRSCW